MENNIVSPFKRRSLGLLLMACVFCSGPARAQEEVVYAPQQLELAKMHALILNDVRLILLEDGDLLGTARTTRNGRALYSATGSYEGLARSGATNWLLYDANHQLTATAFTAEVPLISEEEDDEEDSSPFQLFKKPEVVTNILVTAISIMDATGQPAGTIQNENDAFQYFGPSGKLLGGGEKREDGTLVLHPRKLRPLNPAPREGPLGQP
jgi:hypothetical protein